MIGLRKLVKNISLKKIGKKTKKIKRTKRKRNKRKKRSKKSKRKKIDIALTLIDFVVYIRFLSMIIVF